MLTFLKNTFLYSDKYKIHPEAMIVSCFFNPQNSAYRYQAFLNFYDSIKHMNHRIIECVIGDAKPQLPENENIQRVYSESLLWHKESLLNKAIAELPSEYKYIFWVDADVIFTNKSWLTDSVKELQHCSIVQPFEYCIHLEKDELYPSFDVSEHKDDVFSPEYKNRRLWRSFCANYADIELSPVQQENYNIHGHVGFAWGATREILREVPLYDKALIGGADHIIAHAAAGQIPHLCITKSFADNIDEVNKWSHKFYEQVQGHISYVKGDLYHIWHGDIDKRQYLKRIQDFTIKTKSITRKDKNGLYIDDCDDDQYIKRYFSTREVRDDGFFESLALGYLTDSTLIGTMGGGNLMGAMIGDMLNNDDSLISTDTVFGNGEFGGGGAGGTWEETPQIIDTNIDESVVIVDDTAEAFS
jgi:hypothetical protein